MSRVFPNPRISVVMPVRHAAATLARAVASIRRQTLTDWELVVVDDGLTDRRVVIRLRAVSLTAANKITISRILMVPVFVVALLRYIGSGEEVYRWIAVAVFTLAAVGDGVDGYVARRFNQRTDLGALLDPLADKLLLVLGLVILTLDTRSRLDRIPLWLTGTVVCRDVILLLMLVLVTYLVGHGKVRPRWTGKVATVLQMTCVMWALLKLDPDWLDYLAGGATLGTGVSGVQYVTDGIQMLRGEPRLANRSTPLPPATL